MLPRHYVGEACSIAATLEIVGDRWTMLILRDACRGPQRFSELQNRLGVPRTVLTERLNRLVKHGLLERQLYQERPKRYEYMLTGKGADIWPALKGLMTWGDTHLMGGRPPLVHTHVTCGGVISGAGTCERCGAAVQLCDVVSEPGPGASASNTPQRGRHSS